MKKGLIAILLLSVLLVFPLVCAEAQTQSQIYSDFNRFVDNVWMFFNFGDSKVQVALEIREKEVNSAIENIKINNEEKANENLGNALDKLMIIQEKVSLKNSEEVKISVGDVLNNINEEENLSDDFEKYVLEEEKTYLTAKLTEKTYEYCKELAKEDFALMLKEEICNPDTAIPGLEKELKELKDIQMKLFVQLMLEIRSCIDDPGTCNCEANVDVEQKAKCEKMVALALKCEYKEDETSCDELKAMEALKAESFVPEFLMNLFRAKEEQMLWGTKPSDCVPEECWDYNDKPECRQYDKFKETKEDWDEYGNFIGTRNKCGKEGSTPTMRESIPQCFDGDVFLEEKCGKITMVENEEGLINYLIEKEIDNVITEFENKSAQNTIDKGNWTIDEGEWTVDEGGLEISNKAREIKGEMNQINNQIAKRTYAEGTNAGGEAGVVIKGEKSGIVTDNNANGDDGLTAEIKTYVARGGTKDEPLPEPDLNQINPDLGNHDTTTNNIDEGDGGEGDYAEGTTAGGVDAGGDGSIGSSEGTNTIDP